MKLPTYTSILILFHNLPSHDGFSSTSLYRNCAHKLICNKPSTFIFAKTTTITQLSESTQDEAGDGWYDDYDDFVSNLDFEGGGWDSGADSPFEGDGYGGGRGRGRGGGRGGGGRGGGGGGGYSERSTDFGPKGHDYQRDTSRDDTPIQKLVNSQPAKSKIPNY